MVVKYLLNEGITSKKLQSWSHTSFSEISKIKRKIIKAKIRKRKTIINTFSGFVIFEEEILIDVAISLDLPKDEVIQNYSNYLILRT